MDLDIQELISLPKWSQNKTHIIYELEKFKCEISKKDIEKKQLRTYEITERVTETAKQEGYTVISSYKELPFANAIRSNRAQYLADYLLSCNTSFAYQTIKEGGMKALGEFIIDRAASADREYNKLVAQGEGAVASDYVSEILYSGIFAEFEYSLPLILDFEYEAM